MPLVRKYCHIKATSMEHSDNVHSGFPAPIVGVPHQFNMDELQETILKEYVMKKGWLQSQDQFHIPFHFKDDHFSTSNL